VACRWVRQVQHILADAMQQFCPDIPFVTEYLLADRWYKGLDDQPTDELGRIVPYKTTPWQATGNTAGDAQLLLRRSVAAGVRLLGIKVASAAATVILDVFPAWRIPMNAMQVSNAVRCLSLVMFLVMCITSSRVHAASYQKRDETIIDPIRYVSGDVHPYSGPNLEGWAELGQANLSSAYLARADLRSTDLAGANLTEAYLGLADLTSANLTNAKLWRTILTNADLTGADLTGANLNYAHLLIADLTSANLYGADLTAANYVENTTGSPHYYPNTTLPTGFDPVAKGWTLAPYCNFTGDTPCDVLDINRMFEVGNLRTGVVTSVSTERFDLVDDDIIDAADITEWLSLAATEIGYDTPFSRGDINLDHDVDTRDLTAMIIGFTSAGGTGKTWNTGDTDGDGDVDSTDLTRAIINFTSARNAAAAVPEPSSLLLLVLAIGCLRLRGDLPP